MSLSNAHCNETYDIVSINKALDELGMLSSITQSRQEYIQESDNLLSRLTFLNMNGERAGPSRVDDHQLPVPRNFLFNVENKSNDSSNEKDHCKLAVMDRKEKENKAFEGLHILTMNSRFITSFRTGYAFPLNELIDKSSRRVFRCNVFRKRKWRSHPYERKAIVKVVEHCVNSKQDSFIDLEQTACRLRTTSLSSGTSNSRTVALERYKSGDGNFGLQRSKSMENLMVFEQVTPRPSEKTKDIETVSRGIQQLQMEDCS